MLMRQLNLLLVMIFPIHYEFSPLNGGSQQSTAVPKPSFDTSSTVPPCFLLFVLLYLILVQCHAPQPLFVLYLLGTWARIVSQYRLFDTLPAILHNDIHTMLLIQCWRYKIKAPHRTLSSIHRC